jgi:hypothetical protein
MKNTTFRKLDLFPCLPSPEDGNRSSFRNVVFFIVIHEKSGRWTKSENPISLCTWDRGIESHLRQRCLGFPVFVLPCVGRGLATRLIPRPKSPINCKIHSLQLILNGSKPEGLILQTKQDIPRCHKVFNFNYFSAKIVSKSKCYQGTLSSQLSSRSALRNL